MKITAADKYFSLCVRNAADNTCEWCGKSDARMECSHVYSRRHRTIRWDAMNAVCKCNGCHKKWHESPLNAFTWFESKFGIGRIDLLREKMNMKVKVSKIEEKEIAKHYREQLKEIEAKRAKGEIGHIEFISYQ